MQTTIDQLSRVGEIPRPPTAAPMWTKLTDAAAALGFSPDLLLTAIEAGQLPLRTVQVGRKGLWFVSAPDLAAYRASLMRGAR